MPISKAESKESQTREKKEGCWGPSVNRAKRQRLQDEGVAAGAQSRGPAGEGQGRHRAQGKSPRLLPQNTEKRRGEAPRQMCMTLYDSLNCCLNICSWLFNKQIWQMDQECPQEDPISKNWHWFSNHTTSATLLLMDILIMTIIKTIYFSYTTLEK